MTRLGRHAAPPAPTGSAGALVGTGRLLRFQLRRDRLRILLWLASLVGGTALVAVAFPGIYSDAAARDVVATTMSTPAGLAFTGPADYLRDYTYGAMLSHQMIGFTCILVGLMSVQLVVRHTRAAEEAGYAELLRAGTVGRHAMTVSAFAEAVLVNLALGLLFCPALALLGISSIDWPGSLLFGLAHTGLGITFAGIGLVAAQIPQSSRGATQLGLLVLGAAYVLRAVGDADDSALSWASPIGWSQMTLPYAGDDWSPLLLHVAAAGVFLVLACLLSTRRDLASGLRQARSGRATASAALHHPLGLVTRLQRGSLIAYGFAIAALGAVYGPFFGDVEKMFDDIDVLGQAAAGIGGGSLIDAFVTMIMNIVATLAGVFTLATVLRMRAEERTARAEIALSTFAARPGWYFSHLTLALLGGPVMILLGALALGGTGAPTVDEPGLFGDIMAAAAVYIPALWLLAGLAGLLIGWVPRLAPLAWLTVAYAGFVGYLGPILKLPDWTNWFSPFGHVPRLPVEDMAWTPLFVLTGLACLLVLAGWWGFRRRDVLTG